MSFNIRKMGYVDYFLIVWDFIHYKRARYHSRSGTRQRVLVSYTLGITKADPVRYSLARLKDS